MMGLGMGELLIIGTILALFIAVAVIIAVVIAIAGSRRD